jgi:hypothetical protein
MEEKEFNPDVEQEEQNNEDAQPENEQEELQEELDKAKAEAQKWRAIANRTRNRTSKPLETNNKGRVVDDEIVTTVKNLELIEKKRQFGYENSLSPEETDFIFKFASNAPNKEILENPFIKSGLEGFRATKRLEKNTPSPSGGSSVFGGKDFTELSTDERKKAFEERVKSIKK